MSQNPYAQRLEDHILELSVAQDFKSAKREWGLLHVEMSQYPDQCPCGQEIFEHCYIGNRINENETYVGNVCINKFLGIKTGKLMAGLKRIAKDPSANASLEVINYARDHGLLRGIAEYDFLVSTARSRKLSPKQQAWKRQANLRILGQTNVIRRGVFL